MPPPAEGFAARFVVGTALRTQPDRRLVRLVRDGYENAFEEIVRRYGRPLTRYAAAIVGGRAEDVTQDAFSKALLALRRDGAEIELRPWLFRIVRNTALNDLRDSPPSAEALAEAIASGASPAEELERREELADLMRRLRSLPEAQRAAIVMRELEGLSHEKIAGALGLSDGGARQAIYRARRRLRNGVGVLLPLPLLKALLAGAVGSPVEMVTGAAGVSGGAGAGVALKAAAATVLVAGAVGAGVAIDHNHHPHRSTRTATRRVVADDSAAPVAVSRGGGSGETSGHNASADSGPSGKRGPGDEHGGRRHGGASGDGHGASESGNGSVGSPESSGGGGGSGDPSGGRHSESGDSGAGSGSSGLDGTGEASGGKRRSGRDSSGSSGSGANSSSGDGGGSGDGAGSGPGSTSADDGLNPGSAGSDGGSGLNSGSGSSGGDGSSGSGGGDDLSSSESSGDSHGGEGLSVQMQPQTQEES